MIAENTAASMSAAWDFSTPCTCPCHGFASVRADWELEWHQCREVQPTDYRCEGCVGVMRDFLARHSVTVCPLCQREFRILVDPDRGFFMVAIRR